jgi:ParB family chromosome partitioning protein
MARKDLLKGLMGDQHVSDASKSKLSEKTTDTPPAPSAQRSRYTKGAIGAVSQQIADLKSRSVGEIDPSIIDAGGIKDRLDFDQKDHDLLMASIKEYGQQVPVLVRPHPVDEGRYQIVYGRRRVLALRDLGMPVSAMIRDLDDDALIMAQGQENSARKDLSFIEKANFARQMRDADYDRHAMCAALHIDKTVISRMFSVVDRLPIEVIEAIGAAPNVGRDRWIKMADTYAAVDYDPDDAIAMMGLLGSSTNSDKRFDGLMTALISAIEKRQGVKPKKQPSTKSPLRTTDGTVLGQASWGNGRMTMVVDQKQSNGFDAWLVENIAEIHQGWKKNHGE